MMQLHYFYEFNKKAIWAVVGVIFAALLVAAVFAYVNSRPYTYPHELVAIDSLCDTDAYKAKAELAKIAQRYNTTDNEEKWYYRFLVLKAAVKSNEIRDDAQEAESVVKHYEGNDNIFPHALYFAGCIFRNIEDITTSSQYFLKCLETVGEYQGNPLSSLCHYQLGHNLSMQGLHKEALSYQLKSLQYHKRHNNKRRMLSDYEELAWTYGCLDKKEKAFDCIGKANSLAYATKDSNRISDTECQLSIHNMESGRLNNAKRHIDIALKHIDKSNQSVLFSTALEIYSKLGIDDTARTFCDSIITNGNIYGKKYTYWWLATYYNKRGDRQTTHRCIQKYKEYSDSVSDAVAAEASAKANALYNYEIREKENMALKNENTIKTLYIIAIFSLMMIIILSSVIIYKRIDRKKQEIERRYAMLVELKRKESRATERIIEERERELETIRKELSLTKEQETETRAELGNALLIKEKQLHEINNDMSMKRLSDSSMRKSVIYKRIIFLSESGSPITPTDWDNLSQTLFSIYSSFEDRLSKLCPMNDTELKTCLLIRIGFSPAKISKILNKSQSSIYSINSRLYQKNFGHYASPSEWEKFIRSIY